MGGARRVNLLLDTHVWIWSLLDPERLSKGMRTRLGAPETALWLSPISAWETLMLIERGRLSVPGDGPAWVETAWRSGPFREAPLTSAVAAASRRLAVPVKDPADRFLVASALVYGCAFVTADSRLKAVPGVRVLRA
jgi:PIN domain nuclease of toxin-antitoxin system